MAVDHLVLVEIHVGQCSIKASIHSQDFSPRHRHWSTGLQDWHHPCSFQSWIPRSFDPVSLQGLREQWYQSDISRDQAMARLLVFLHIINCCSKCCIDASKCAIFGCVVCLFSPSPPSIYYQDPLWLQKSDQSYKLQYDNINIAISYSSATPKCSSSWHGCTSCIYIYIICICTSIRTPHVRCVRRFETSTNPFFRSWSLGPYYVHISFAEIILWSHNASDFLMNNRHLS